MGSERSFPTPGTRYDRDMADCLVLKPMLLHPKHCQLHNLRVHTDKQIPLTRSKPSKGGCSDSQDTRTGLRNPPSSTTPHFSESKKQGQRGKRSAQGHSLRKPRDTVARITLPGSPLPTLLVMVWLCSRITALFTASDSSSWHHDLSRTHSGFSRRRVTWLTKVPVTKRRDPAGDDPCKQQCGLGANQGPKAEVPGPFGLRVINSVVPKCPQPNFHFTFTTVLKGGLAGREPSF